MPSDFDLRSLDEDPPTPSRVDVERAIADGRRRKTRRGVGYAGAATLTVAAVVGASVAAGGLLTDDRPNPNATDKTDTPVATGLPKAEYTIPGIAGWQPPAAVTPPTSCTLEQLPMPDGEPMALTSGADPTGKYIVGRTYPGGGRYRGVIWQDGQASVVDLPGDMEESLTDVNSAGTAVGWSYPDDLNTTPEADSIPYVYSGGQISQLPGAPTGNAYAINEAGAIAGDVGGVPVVWPSATEEPIRLPLPEGTQKGAVADIDEDGTTVGTVGDPGDDRPYVWFADGTHRALEVPDIDGVQVKGGRAFTIRNGWVTGLATTHGDNGVPGSEGATQAIRWNVHTGETRVFNDEFDIRANMANAHGWQVGTNKEGDAVLVTDTSTVVLPPLFDHEPGGLTNIPGMVTDDGRLVTGQSDDAAGTIKPVVWRCE